MHTTPSFQLTSPAPPAWDATQDALFALDGRPTPSRTDAEKLRDRVACLVDSAGVPASHRTSFTRALCDGAPIDPGFVLWLASPENGQHWRHVVEALDPSYEGAASALIRSRARGLLARAEATRSWPQRAITCLRRQRSESGAIDLSVFPQLPTQLRAWRQPLHVAAMEMRALLYDALARPAKVTSSGDSRSVVMMGCMRLKFDLAQRDIRVWQRGASEWVPCPDRSANLLQPFADDTWCGAFALRLSQQVRVFLGASWTEDKVREGCFRWLADVVQKLTLESGLIEHVGKRLRRAYACDAQLVRDVLACRINPRHPVGLTAGSYVMAWRHAEILRARVSESPQLAPVWGLAVSTGHLTLRDGYDGLRKLFRNWGITPFGWRLLARWARLLYRPLIQYADKPSERCARLADYVRFLQDAQMGEPLPHVLAKALFSPHWFSNQLIHSTIPLGLLRGALERVKGAMPLGATEAFIEQEFVPVLGWIARAEPEFDANQQRASWHWFFSRYQQWCEAERLQREGRCWTTGLDGLRWRCFDIVPIRDSATLWLEGEQMRMCLSLYDTACAEGRYLVYAVRASGRSRPVAHIGLRLNADGTATLDQVCGFANAPVEPALVQYARRLSEMHLEHSNRLIELEPGS